MGNMNVNWQIWEWIFLPEGWTVSIPVSEAIWYLHNPIANGQNALWITYHVNYHTLEIYLFHDCHSNSRENWMSHSPPFHHDIRQEQIPRINTRQLEIIIQYPRPQNMILNNSSINISRRYNENRMHVDYYLYSGEIFYQRIHIINARPSNNHNFNTTNNGQQGRRYLIEDHIIRYHDYYNFWQANGGIVYNFFPQIIDQYSRANYIRSNRGIGNEQPLDLSTHPARQYNNRRNARVNRSHIFQPQEEVIQQIPDNDENTTTLP